MFLVLCHYYLLPCTPRSTPYLHVWLLSSLLHTCPPHHPVPIGYLTGTENLVLRSERRLKR